ncbi:MAG TPA: flagellar protein FlbD [Planctomycetaceae bacterium]|nr:flagellar protein FlbD [Planctomycetaceae bacterium]
MIKLTRIDGEPFVLNAEMIRYVEKRPDTFITLTTGERIIVGESMDEVVDRAIRYQQQKHWLPLSGLAVTAPVVASSLAPTP